MSQTSESLPSQDSVAADPPSLPGSWLLGNAKEILRDTGALLTDAHDRLGPVYRVRVLWHSYLVIAGSAARDFIRLRLDEEHCSRHEFFAAIEREFGSADLSLAHSGERHSRLRQPLSLAYSRQVASPFVPEFVLAVSNIARRWAVGSTYCVMDEMKRLAFAQYCKVMAGDAADRMDFRDCLLVSEYGMNVGGRIWPEAVFHLPWYRAAHRRSFLILRRIVAERRGKSPGAGGSGPTIIDTLLSTQDSAGQPVTEEETVTYAAYGIAASCAYVARLTGFMLYEILADPELKERLTRESDGAFVRGLRDAEDVRSALPLLRSVYQETLRLHPISPGMPYTVEQDFEFLGKRFRKGETVVVSPVPLALSKCPFHQPLSFDPSRFDAPRAEHRKGDGFHPFGLGHRACLATGLVELMAITSIATLLHERALTLDPPDYRLRLHIRPLPAPDRHFRVRIAERTPSTVIPATLPHQEEAAFALFSGHDHPVVSEALAGSESRSFPPGAIVFRQGDTADGFYILTSGSVTVSQTAGNVQKSLATLGAGDCFGEMGLLQDAPRNATISAGPKGASTLLMSRESFLRVIAATDLVASEIGGLARRRSAINGLRQMAPSLDSAEAARLLPEFTHRLCAPCEIVICEGDPAEHFFILIKGAALVSRRTGGNNDETIAQLHPGDYFGETGLLTGAPRNATVTIASETPAVVLVAGRQGFGRLLAETGGLRGELATAMLARLPRIP